MFIYNIVNNSINACGIGNYNSNRLLGDDLVFGYYMEAYWHSLRGR